MKQKYDNQGGVNQAKAKVNELVKKGYRLSKNASGTYHDAVIQHGGVRERNQAVLNKMDNEMKRSSSRKKKR